MANWTPDQSISLSLLLDDVVGTEEMIGIRQDFCRIRDYFASQDYKMYFTGSKSEGLHLPGSDEDYMFDINDMYNMKVIQSLDEMPQMSSCSIWLMSVENVSPAFALLQRVEDSQMSNRILTLSTQTMNGLQYLSSDCIVNNISDIYDGIRPAKLIKRRQGPSLETWNEYQDPSGEGTDVVPSIHCEFWPFIAAELPERQRHYGWPNSRDISSITEFGCHLVPVGHPHSDTKLMQWRISFSVAERTLVWSFNHVQIQCYAIMKIVLKEFIKVRCSPQSQVLCSFFIKTFLFWKYETNELMFWRADNLRECFKYVLTEFSKCVREGVLPHYFIPSFNLLSVKLTRAAQVELLQLFDIIIQSDIKILKECRTLRNIWPEVFRIGENKNKILACVNRRNVLKNAECMMKAIAELDITSIYLTLENGAFTHKDGISIFLSLPCQTQLDDLALKRCFFSKQLKSLEKQCSTNKSIYEVYQIALCDIKCPDDISTCKLRCALLLVRRGDYSTALNIIYHVLSNIPPFAIYYSKAKDTLYGNKELYVDTILDYEIATTQRPRKAWLFDILLWKDMTEFVPLGIQIELHFCDPEVGVYLSPFTCTYYLQFLCYHEIRQSDNRDRALQHLIDVAYSDEQTGLASFSLNLAGHCLLVAGERERAKCMFMMSDFVGKMNPPIDKYNSAAWYLRNFF